MLYEAKFGAYTELYAGLSPDITEEHNGAWGTLILLDTSILIRTVAPFGKLAPVRQDVLDPALGKRYWEWMEEQTKAYM